MCLTELQLFKDPKVYKSSLEVSLKEYKRVKKFLRRIHDLV